MPSFRARPASAGALLVAWLAAGAAMAQPKEPLPAPGGAPPPSPEAPKPPEGELPPPAPPEGVPQPTPTEAETPAAGPPITLDDFTNASFDLVQPKISLLELDGYFRMRATAFRKLDFENNTSAEVPLSDTDPGRFPATDDGNASYTTSDMRLRLAPKINITDRIAVMATLDAFDNLVLGSTPKAIQHQGGTPDNVLAKGQTTVSDALVLKHAWASVAALNDQLQLTVGRMPAHWGLGMLSNGGGCLDCDFGDTVDRVSVGFRVEALLFILMYDWVSSGPTFSPYGRSGGQPLDSVSWDDVDQYSLRVLRQDSEPDVREAVLQGQMVLNYGFWAAWRKQNRDLPASYYVDQDTDTPGVQPNVASLEGAKGERRNANIVTTDGFLRLYSGELELGAEGAAIFGNFLDNNIEGEDRTSVLQYGGALEAFWHFRGDAAGTALGLRSGLASGDKSHGFGALDRSGSQRGSLLPNGKTDVAINNFQFSPDYHVDLLLFRHVIGTVTDAWYARPEVAYAFDNSISGKFAVMYAQALYKASTPSALSRSTPDQTASSKLGVEVDAELSYGGAKRGEASNFSGLILGGILVPFGGFKNYALENTPAADAGGSFAWTLQAHLNFVF